MTTAVNNYRWLIILLALFVLTRFFGLDQFYHQDEYRWVSIANSEVFGKLSSPHPPIMEYMLSLSGKLFGYDNLRVVPMVFSVFNLLLIYLLALRLPGKRKAAYLATGFLLVSTYGLIASTQIDIDGAILPFFVLLSYYFYLKLFVDKERRFIWLFLAAVIGGFMAKLSFLLFVIALAAHHLLLLYRGKKLKVELRKAKIFLLSVPLLALAIYIFYNFENSRIFEYAAHFKVFNFGSRAYFELFLRLFKFFIWFSPILFLPIVAGLFKKDIFIRHQVWYFYILINLAFYLVIFDFARLPIERYFMFIIGPSVLISADILYSLTPRFDKKYFFIGLAGFILLLMLTIVATYDIIPLNPKEAYVNRVRSVDFNFLIPLTGGSGPIGFYASAKFVLWAWVISAATLLVGFFTKRHKGMWMIIFIVFGVGYNIVLSSEHLTGSIYGNVDKITKRSVDYIINNDDIKGIITYYDAGVYYLKLKNKYDSRFYTAPTRDYSKKLTDYRGHYLIVDFPSIDKKSEYWRLISRCDLDQKFTDKYLDSYVFDCRSLPPQ